MPHPLRILGRALAEPMLLRDAEMGVVERLGRALLEGSLTAEEVKERGWVAAHRNGRTAVQRRAALGPAGAGAGNAAARIAGGLADPAVRYGGSVMLDAQTALVSIAGVLDKSEEDVTDSEGEPFGTAYERIAATADMLAGHPGVRTVVVRVDSPGGSSAGVDVAAAALRRLAAAKETWAVVDDTAASGGYWLAVQVGPGRLLVTTTGWVGSIGAVQRFTDQSRQLDARGLTVNAIKSTQTKDVGASYRPMEPADRAVLQQQIDTLGGLFVEVVMAGRGVDAQTVAQWQAAEGDFGRSAVERGMADGVVSSLAEWVERVTSGTTGQSGAGRPGATGPHDTGATMSAAQTKGNGPTNTTGGTNSTSTTGAAASAGEPATVESLTAQYPELVAAIRGQAAAAARAEGEAPATLEQLTAEFGEDDPAFVMKCLKDKASMSAALRTRVSHLKAKLDETAAALTKAAAQGAALAGVPKGQAALGHQEPKAAGAEDFDDKVRQIMAENPKLTRTEATSAAVAKFPELHRAKYGRR